MPRLSCVGVVLSSVLLVGCEPGVDLAAEEAALRARIQGVVAAEARMASGDAVAFYHTDAIVLPSAAPMIRGRDNVRAMYQEFFDSGMLKGFESSVTQLEMAASGDLAYEYGINRFTLNLPSGEALDVGKYVAVWKKVDGEWYAVLVAFNSDAPAPTPVATGGM